MTMHQRTRCSETRVALSFTAIPSVISRASLSQSTCKRLTFTAERTRRLRAATLFARGLTPPEVAKQLGVSRNAAYQWYRAWLADGRKALVGKPNVEQTEAQ